jgi:hypothetical protein
MADLLANRAKKFISDGSGNSLGLKFSVKYPSAFQSIEPRHPHVVANLTNNTNCSYVVLVQKLASTPTDADKKMGCSSEVLKANIPKGSFYLTSQSGIKIDGEAACFVEYYLVRNINSGSETNVFYFYNRNYSIYYKDYLITITCGVYAKDKSSSIALFNSYKGFFALVMNNFILLSKWS